MLNKLKNRITLILLILMAIFPAAVTAQDATSDIDYSSMFDDTAADESSAAKGTGSDNMGFSLSFTGDHTFSYRLPVIKDHQDYYGSIKGIDFENVLGLEIKYQFVKLKSEWNIDIPLNDSGDITKMIKVKPLENSITLSPWRFNVGAGLLYYTWGTGDKINPTDNINSFDYTKGADKEKNPILSAYAEFFPVQYLSAQLVYVPFINNDIYTSDITDTLKENLLIDDIEIKLPEYDPKTFSLGGKLNFFLQYIDFSLSYLYGYDHNYTPEIELAAVKAGQDVAFYKIESIDLTRKRMHFFGADFKTTIDRFGIWGELCYAMSEDYLMNTYKIKNHKFSWVAGFDFNYGYNNDFYFSFQFSGDFTPYYDTTLDSDYNDSDFYGTKLPFQTGKEKDYYEEYYDRSLVNSVSGVTEGLNLIGAIAFKFPVKIQSITVEPSIALSYMKPFLYDDSDTIRYGSTMIKPEIKLTPIDSLSLTLGADLYFSFTQDTDKSYVEFSSTDKLGTYYYDSSIYFSINYKWGFDLKK